MFDKGVFFVNEDMTLDRINGRLALHKNHRVESDYFAYHRGMFDRDKKKI